MGLVSLVSFLSPLSLVSLVSQVSLENQVSKVSPVSFVTQVSQMSPNICMLHKDLRHHSSEKQYTMEELEIRTHCNLARAL